MTVQIVKRHYIIYFGLCRTLSQGKDFRSENVILMIKIENTFLDNCSLFCISSVHLKTQQTDEGLMKNRESSLKVFLWQIHLTSREKWENQLSRK